jgi:hypothetical protein
MSTFSSLSVEPFFFTHAPFLYSVSSSLIVLTRAGSPGSQVIPAILVLGTIFTLAFAFFPDPFAFNALSSGSMMVSAAGPQLSHAASSAPP